MCFIGTTLNEFHLRFHMKLDRGDRRHVLLCKDREKPTLVGGPNGISERRDGIIVAGYQNHLQLDGFAATLTTVSRAVVPTTPVAAAETRILPYGYIGNVLYERGQRIEESDRIAAWILDTSYGPEPFGEADIAQGQRTLIIGAPGSGKSELLRKAGELVPRDEFPVLIRCADLEPQAGDAAIILEKAAAAGVGLRDDVVVSGEALRRRRFHFFFDGLDEKALEQQENLAALVVELARVFPQHRFTVASRPVDAVDVFPVASEDHGGEWRVLELVPDRDWQARYLAAAGVNLSELEAEMPALTDLGGLLQLPFFLAKTVELHDEGQLRDFEDLWALVQGLVTAALRRETAIPLPQEEARGWLRDVALAMHLSGVTALTLDELARVPLSTAVQQLVGSAEKVAADLVVRVLLLERDGHFAFAHRIIGEALAAEALDALEPGGALLDAVVPVRDDDVRGVRSDWLMPLAFLLGRNSKWRAATAERDPLAAARAVPPTESLEERELASRMIWSTYCNIRVWIWDYETPDLIEDAEALARLLRTDGMADLVEEVRAGIEDASPRVQGNAIRVLSGVKPDGFVDDLRRVLGDRSRDGVVRRQAAIAARDIGEKELLPLIIECAVETTDSAVAQDCSSCAFDLADEDQLVETAIRLAANRESRIMAEVRLKGRVSPEEMIRFLRAQTEADADPYGSESDLYRNALKDLTSND